MIAETGTTERGDDPAAKAAWICDAFRRALPEALPRVKAVLWFHQPTDEGGKPFPWEADSSEASREAFAVGVAPESPARCPAGPSSHCSPDGPPKMARFGRRRPR